MSVQLLVGYSLRLNRRVLFYSKRLYTTGTSITVKREKLENSQIATVILHHSPVNSFNVSFALELLHTLKEIEDSNEVKAIVLKSSLPGIFSAGLDLNDLHGVSRDHLKTFWRTIQNLWLQIYSSKLITLACIDGHCLAAGTIIAAACDYRIGTEGKYSMGVTAAKIGLIAPPWFLEMLSHIMGRRKTDHALQTGLTFSPGEALKIGLIDRLCPPHLAIDCCSQALKPYLSVSQESRMTMKYYSRSELIQSFKETRNEDMINFVDFVMRESVQESLDYSLKQLKRKT